ncbi:hypothetical protein [Spirosoma linguale]|uniref:Uncharacterized protein n=1 Tax=Spirosoma linguale (strain ATCC 33905 / DSM 74 / LMG 10896 / Claus 1) TaxID=504472 RepID=D2QBW6_SPILD|nr:conserved hypothetical protein [Spirosoma linguale DSM 74]
MEYISTIREISRAFNKYSVEYIFVGGVAVGFHGYVRPSMAANKQYVDKPDIDVWYNPSPANFFKILDAVEELGGNADGKITRLRNATTIDPTKAFIPFKFEDYTLDLLPSIKLPSRFWPCFKRCQTLVSEDVEIKYLSLEDLIADKETEPRDKDKVDIEQLKQILAKRS